MLTMLGLPDRPRSEKPFSGIFLHTCFCLQEKTEQISDQQTDCFFLRKNVSLIAYEYFIIFSFLKYHRQKTLIVIIYRHGHLAQLGEHLLDVEGVRGSSPLVSTMFNIKCPVTGHFLFVPLRLRKLR